MGLSLQKASASFSSTFDTVSMSSRLFSETKAFISAGTSSKTSSTATFSLQ